MPKKVVYQGSVEHWSVMDKDGKTLDKTLMPKLSGAQVKEMLRGMILGRVFDDKCFKLQRQGRMGTYAQSLGQEACQAPVALAMQKQDWVFPCFREHPIILMRGFPMAQYMWYWGGDERGMKVPEGVNVFPVSVPVGTQMLHAVGYAWGNKLQGKDVATVTYFGDGGTSEGDFHEAMNFAGVFQTPTVFVCQNNQWAISVPRKKQTHAETIAQKALAYGFEGIQVDGNDAFAVYAAAKHALDKAHAGKGPTLLELMTYRMADHTTSDDAKKYRPPEEVAYWRERDPIDRLKKYGKANGLWDEAFEQKCVQEATALVEKAVEEYEAFPRPGPEEMFKYMYKEMTMDLQEQMGLLLKWLDEEGQD